MADKSITKARQMAAQYSQKGDTLGWFEAFYSRVYGETKKVPWADLEPNPNLVEWLDQQKDMTPAKAIKIGCGLGDDAEELSARGFETTAFDISESAIKWCKKRYSKTRVTYTTADLLALPEKWIGGFDFVVEAYTLQILPQDLREDAIRATASLVAPGGRLIVIARAREADEPLEDLPWPLAKDELLLFETHGLEMISIEDFMDRETPPVRRFRAVFTRMRSPDPS